MWHICLLNQRQIMSSSWTTRSQATILSMECSWRISVTTWRSMPVTSHTMDMVLVSVSMAEQVWTTVIGDDFCFFSLGQTTNSLFTLSLISPPLPLEVGSLNTARAWGSIVISSVRFGESPSQPTNDLAHIWVKNSSFGGSSLLILVRINVIFCTEISLIPYSVKQ